MLLIQFERRPTRCGRFLEPRGEGEAARLNVEQGHGGAIVAVSSISALVGGEFQTHYTPTKAGVHSLMQSAAIALGKHGIRCNAVCPGALEQTPDWGDHPDPDGREQAMVGATPLGRLGTSEDIAPWIAFLISDESSFATGGTFVVDGGITIS